MQSAEQQQTSSSYTSTTKKTVQQQVFQSSHTGSLDQGQDNLALGSSASTDNMQVGLQDFVFRPTLLNFDSMRSLMSSGGLEFEDVTKQVSETVKDGQNFEMTLDVQGFNPNDISVKVSDNLVTISAKQEIKTETHSSSRQFSKKFSIPSNVKPENITCTFTTSGKLRISAPLEQRAAAITQGQVQQVQNKNQASRQTSVASDVSSVSTATSNLDELIMRPMRLMNTTMSQELCNVTDSKKFEIKLDLSGFKAEEVQVKITKSLIKIEAKHESQFASKSFYKEQTIPYGVKPDSIQCTMNDDGIMTISAPIQQQTQQQMISQSQTSQSQNVQQQTQQNVQQSRNVQQTQNVQQSVQQAQQNVQQSVQQTQNIQQQAQNVQKSVQQQESVQSSRKSSVTSDASTLHSFPDDLLVLRPSLSQLMPFSSSPDNEKFEMKLDLSGFKTEEVQVRITKSIIKIEAKQVTQFSSRSFNKEQTIPYGVKPETIQCTMTEEGIMTISAPIQKQVSQQTITQTQQTQSQTQKRLLQETGRKDSSESVRSTIGSSSDLILQPILNSRFDLNSLSSSLFEDISKQIYQVDAQENERKVKKFETKIDVTGFQPNELTVKISDNMVIIEGKQETTTTSKQFFKKFSIPPNVKPEKIQSSLSPQGILTVSAPFEQQTQASSLNSSMSSITSASDLVQLRPIVQSQLQQDSTRFEDISKQLCQVQDGKKFETKLEVAGFKPEELSIKISTEENMVTISAKQETANSSKSFFKKFSLPLGVRHEEITSSLSREGTLTISAPIHAEDVQKQMQVVSSTQQNVGPSSTVTSSKVSQSFATSSVSSSQTQQTQSQQQKITSSSNNQQQITQ